MKALSDWLPSVRGNLIVSCQALPGEPLHGAPFMARMALAAQLGGATAIRANSPDDIRAIRAVVDLPILGLYKADLPGYEVHITPTLEHAQLVVAAGADVVCIDATQRLRPGGHSLQTLIQAIREATGCPVLADISTLEEALHAEAAGADLVASTLSGYTPYSRQSDGPDLELVQAMALKLRIPAFAEGRYHYPEQAAAAIRLGAYAVIVGGAITRPAEITKRFTHAVTAARPRNADLNPAAG